MIHWRKKHCKHSRRHLNQNITSYLIKISITNTLYCGASSNRTAHFLTEQTRTSHGPNEHHRSSDIHPNGFSKTYIQTASAKHTSQRLQQDIHPNGFSKIYIQTASARHTSKRLQQDIHPNGLNPNGFQQDIHLYSSQQIWEHDSITKPSLWSLIGRLIGRLIGQLIGAS